MPFEKGKSGNPDGRTKGRKNNASLVRDALIKTYGSQEAFVLSLAERSKEDTSIARELFSRISPSLKSVMPTVALDIQNNGQASEYHREIVLAAMRGDCPADVAQALAAVVEQMARSETFSDEATELLQHAQRLIDSKRGNTR
ncbi:DUF5681 domain-containing protein [Aeromonas bivalvium]|uniref:DUF5681 domain-containing protein n=1 Tax=Aeromonas bivalvium TaxID=440079 RepID=UPI0038D2536E